MDKVTGNKAVIASGANFKGQIKNTPSIEINGTVEADINAEKLTIGEGGKFVGAANVELVVISGHYDGNMDAGSIWATATAEISGKIQYKTIQLDRGAALNCRFIHNWNQEKITSKKNDDLAAKKGRRKKDDIDIKGHETVDKITEIDKTNKKSTRPMEKTEAAGDESKSAMNAFDEQGRSHDSDFRLFADWSKKVVADDKQLRGKRLGIFKFGSRAAKLPDAQG
jgi:cytoskeletal protein CcmA (bactofilin family)